MRKNIFYDLLENTSMNRKIMFLKENVKVRYKHQNDTTNQSKEKN